MLPLYLKCMLMLSVHNQQFLWFTFLVMGESSDRYTLVLFSKCWQSLSPPCTDPGRRNSVSLSLWHAEGGWRTGEACVTLDRAATFAAEMEHVALYMSWPAFKKKPCRLCCWDGPMSMSHFTCHGQLSKKKTLPGNTSRPPAMAGDKNVCEKTVLEIELCGRCYTQRLYH